jgi:hypothetical protein
VNRPKVEPGQLGGLDQYAQAWPVVWALAAG